jgi:hypothetical protein
MDAERCVEADVQRCVEPAFRTLAWYDLASRLVYRHWTVALLQEYPDTGRS